jgi:hypothetical protein
MGTPESGAGVPITGDLTRIIQYLSDDGDRVFFDSFQALVPQDSNGLADVYEWERDGTGTCTLPKGCVSLLSGGGSSDNSYLLATGSSGDDLFFVSRAQLTAQSNNGNRELYDARADGIVASAASACSGTGCQGVPSAPPIFATPSSVTFNGVGNFVATRNTQVKRKAKPSSRAQKLAAALRACKKKRGKPRDRCESRAKHRYAAKPTAKSKSRSKGGK